VKTTVKLNLTRERPGTGYRINTFSVFERLQSQLARTMAGSDNGEDVEAALRLPSFLLETLLKKRRQIERLEHNRELDEAERLRNRLAKQDSQRDKQRDRAVGKRRRRRWDNGHSYRILSSLWVVVANLVLLPSISFGL
jgi:hypothetical protein